MASSVGGDAGEGEWLKVAELRAMAEAQDPHVKEVDNMTLRRFLRARDHDVSKASAMLLKFVAWRREAVPGGVMPAEQVRRELSDDKARMGGVDRAGRPVVFAFPAKHFSANRDMAEHKRFLIYLLDKICARIPRGQDKFMCVVDLKGWGYANSDVRAYIATIEIMQSYYPERLGKALMVHVPYIFMKAWKMVYPFIDTNTRAKIMFIDDKNLDETLRQEMEESQVPEIYGGKLTLIPLADD
ncbi:phosphatidylinositol transfer protein 3-like isoform X1 [Lolium rigidum]|uniref:phosphatidylinositol transfer protein 3-like isoform X1 n=2 Tax=Lolium rigidum TaxID=89674 RepID=UPI001F5CC3A5|nr:phosphatidylinositol transfer protein 3-like isoform X1 [Lolium rigidum]